MIGRLGRRYEGEISGFVDVSEERAHMDALSNDGVERRSVVDDAITETEIHEEKERKKK